MAENRVNSIPARRETRTPAQTQEEIRHRFQRHGLYASVVERNPGGRRLTIHGKEVIFEDNRYTSIDFMPGGRTYFDAAEITDSLVNGIAGMIELFTAIDEGQIKVAPTFMCVTNNLNMALIAQRLGFFIVDQCRTPDGHIDRTRKDFTIIGRLGDIKARVEEYKRKKTLEKLQARQQRHLQSNPQKRL